MADFGGSSVDSDGFDNDDPFAAMAEQILSLNKQKEEQKIKDYQQA